jgi:hypothetical protein
MPYLKRIVDAVHAKGGKLIKLSDGIMWDALDTFEELGVDGWHGIQPASACTPELLKMPYGGKFCLFGGVNVETIIAARRTRSAARCAGDKICGPRRRLVMACGNI